MRSGDELDGHKSIFDDDRTNRVQRCVDISKVASKGEIAFPPNADGQMDLQNLRFTCFQRGVGGQETSGDRRRLDDPNGLTISWRCTPVDGGQKLGMRIWQKELVDDSAARDFTRRLQRFFGVRNAPAKQQHKLPRRHRTGEFHVHLRALGNGIEGDVTASDRGDFHQRHRFKRGRAMRFRRW